MIARAETHPRPQLTRERWTDLCGPWQFAYDDADAGLRGGWNERADPFDRTIEVPFPPESRASGIGDPSPHPVVWYRRLFQVPSPSPQHRGECWLVHFGAVDYLARVWVNGRLVASHEGGHTPFSADITTALRDDVPDQVIVVRAEDQPADLTQPRGKQFWEPAPGASGITGRPGSGSPSGWSRSPRPTSPACAGHPTSTAGCSAWG